jgi:hypothetical protein
MVPNSLVGRTAYTLSVALNILAILHFYWAFGGTWGLAAALGRQQIDPSHGLRVAAGAVGVVLLVAAVGVLGRACLWGDFVPWVLFYWGTWALVSGLFLAAILNLTAQTWRERLVFAPIALVLGAAGLLIARSARP